MRHHDSYTELNRSAEQSILKSPHFTKVPSSKEKLSPLGTELRCQDDNNN